MTPQQIEALKMALDLATMHHTDDGYAALRSKVRSASKEALAQTEQEPVAIDQATMELAESVGLIGPTSRTHDLHQAIQRFHDLICVNATVKAAQMAADVIRESTPPQRKWVGLTRRERFEIEKAMSKYYDYQHECKTVCLPEFAAAYEAKLKEKNGV